VRAGRERDVWLYRYVLYDSYFLRGKKEEKEGVRGSECVVAIFKKITGSRFSSIVELKKSLLVHQALQEMNIYIYILYTPRT